MDMIDTAQYAHIVGVFRDRAKADQAVEAIKQAGMSAVALTVYDPQAAGVVDTPVDAGEASAMDTSVDTSAVETAGTMLVHGSIVSADEDSAEPRC